MSSSKSNSARVPGWDRALEDLATAHVSIAPEWGVSDCLMTAADAIKAVTGEDPLAEFRGKYKTEAGAARKMRANGCENVRTYSKPISSLSRSIGSLPAVAMWALSASMANTWPGSFAAPASRRNSRMGSRSCP